MATAHTFSSYTQEDTGYEVTYQGKIVFTSMCYAMCNDYIFRNGLQGVRPKMIEN